MAEDRIIITDLRLRGFIGIEEWESARQQEIVVNLTLFADLRRAGATDDVGDSVDYAAVGGEVKAHVESARRGSLEALAADIARICLAKTGVRRVRVRVEKPTVARFEGSVGVEIERRAEDYA